MRYKRDKKYLLKALPIMLVAAYSCSTLAAETLEEVVVTAQKRVERLQDVPISISAISGAQLEARGIEGVANLNALAPNLMFRSNPSSNLISTVAIRGSVTGQPAIWVDPSVGMYVDGVYVGKAQGSIFDVIEIERVEVLRGPQGTLFGRNTEGGAVNFISRKPAGVFSGSVGLEVGNRGHVVTRAAVDLPQMGIMSLSMGYRKEDRDGWVKNNTPGVGDLGKRDKEAYRLAAKFDISPNLEVNYKFDHSEADNTPPPSFLYALSGWGSYRAGTGVIPGTFPSIYGALGSAIQNALSPYVVTDRPKSISTNAGNPLWEKSKTDGHALTVDYRLDTTNALKYIYAKREMKYQDSIDIDGSPVGTIATGFPAPFPTTWSGNIYTRRYTDYESDSHELQWVGNTDRMNYVFGLYYFKDEATTLGPQDLGIFYGPSAAYYRSDYASDTKAKAWFGQVDYKITNDLTATVGMRHTIEEKSGWTHRYMTPLGFNNTSFTLDNIPTLTMPMQSYKASFSSNTPVLALGYKLNDTTNVYGRMAKGFKSGGFSGELVDPVAIHTPYNPEKSLSVEVGVKSSFLDNRAQLSAAIFHTKITDLNVTQLLPGTTSSFLSNAGKAIYKGFELEGAVLVADGWKVQGGYGYLDTKFDEYIDNALNAPGAPTVRPLIDTAGNRHAPYAPKHTMTLSLDGRLAKTSFGTLRLIMDYSYTAKTYLYAANKSLTASDAGGSYVEGIDEVPAQTNINARLLLADIPVGGPGRADFSLWVKNLTDEKKVMQKIDFGMYQTANYQEPRSYGMSFNYKW